MTGANVITGTGVPVRGDGIACDQILPREGNPERPSDLLFAGADEGAVVAHFEDARFRDATVLLVNRAFGGDSRPAVPEALADWGIDAVVGESFGNGFVADCVAADVAIMTASERDVRAVQEWVLENPDGKLEVDVDDELLVYGVRNHDERDGDGYQPGFAAEEFVSVTVAD